MVLSLQSAPKKLDWINLDCSPRIKRKTVFKPKLFDVCTDFTKVSLEIRARVISRGLIICLRRSEVSDLSRSGLVKQKMFKNTFEEERTWDIQPSWVDVTIPAGPILLKQDGRIFEAFLRFRLGTVNQGFSQIQKLVCRSILSNK